MATELKEKKKVKQFIKATKSKTPMKDYDIVFERMIKDHVQCKTQAKKKKFFNQCFLNHYFFKSRKNQQFVIILENLQQRLQKTILRVRKKIKNF